MWRVLKRGLLEIPGVHYKPKGVKEGKMGVIARHSPTRIMGMGTIIHTGAFQRHIPLGSTVGMGMQGQAPARLAVGLVVVLRDVAEAPALEEVAVGEVVVGVVVDNPLHSD